MSKYCLTDSCLTQCLTQLCLKQLYHEVIHKVHMLERGRGGPAKSILARMGEGKGSAVSVHTPWSFFAGPLQNKSKSIVQKKIIKKSLFYFLDTNSYKRRTGEGNLKEKEIICARTLFILLCNYLKTYTASSKYHIYNAKAQ